MDTNKAGNESVSSDGVFTSGKINLVSTRRRVLRRSNRGSSNHISTPANDDKDQSLTAIGTTDLSRKVSSLEVSTKREEERVEADEVDASSSDSDSTTRSGAAVPIRKVASHKKSPTMAAADSRFVTPAVDRTPNTPLVSAGKVTGHVSRQKELFAAAMKTLEDKKPATKPTGGFSAATIGQVSYRRDSPLRPVVVGGAFTSPKVLEAKTATDISTVSPKSLATRAGMTATAGFGDKEEHSPSKHGVISSPSSSFSAYLAAKKAKLNADSVATSRRVVRNKELDEALSENTEK